MSNDTFSVAGPERVNQVVLFEILAPAGTGDEASASVQLSAGKERGPGEART